MKKRFNLSEALKGGIESGKKQPLDFDDAQSVQQSVVDIPLGEIRVISNPREQFDAESIGELANSIKEIGLLQPVTVRKKGDHYELIAGERRLRAFRHLGRKTIPAISFDVARLAPDKHAAARLVENIQRENLSPAEQAKAVEALVLSVSGKQVEAGRLLGRSKTWVSRKMAHADLIRKDKRYEELESEAAINLAKSGGLDQASGGGAPATRERTREKLRRRNSVKATSESSPEKRISVLVRKVKRLPPGQIEQIARLWQKTFDEISHHS